MSEIASIRYDRGDGNLFWLSPSEVKDFVARNPGAHPAEGRSAPPETTPQEEAATAAQSSPIRLAELEAQVADLEVKNAELVANALDGLTEGHLDAEWLVDLKHEQLVSIGDGFGLKFEEKATKGDMAAAIAAQVIYYNPVSEEAREAEGNTPD